MTELAAIERLISLSTFIFHEFLLFNSFRFNQCASICHMWPRSFPEKKRERLPLMFCLKS